MYQVYIFISSCYKWVKSNIKSTKNDFKKDFFFTHAEL